MFSEGDGVQRMIAAARGCQPGTIPQLLESYRHYLQALARTSIRQALSAKVNPSDLVQETLVKANQNFGAFRGNSEQELVAWLRQILAQNVAQLVRRFGTDGRAVSRECSLEKILAHSSATLGNVIAASGTSPSVAAQRRDNGLVLANALQKLSEDYREVIMLRNLEQLSWSEVAQRMNRSPDAVRMLWTRALQQLRPLIEGQL